MFLWSVVTLCWSGSSTSVRSSPRENLRPECLPPGADHDSADIRVRSRVRGPQFKWSYTEDTKEKNIDRVGGGGGGWRCGGGVRGRGGEEVCESILRTGHRSHRRPKIRGTVLRGFWAGFCRPGSSCSAGTSLFALACRSAAERRQTCGWRAPACSCWSPRARGSPGSPGGGGNEIRHTDSETRAFLFPVFTAFPVCCQRIRWLRVIRSHPSPLLSNGTYRIWMILLM